MNARDSAPAFSVVIPVYNAAGNGEASARSVLDQTFGDIEVIVVDDGSTDGSADRIRSVGDPRLRIVAQDNRGQAAARNRGIEAARAPWIAFQDADDLWLPDKLEAQFAQIRAFPEAEWFCADAAMFRGTTVTRTSVFGGRPPRGGRVLHDLLLRNFIVTQTVIVKTDTIRRLGGFDPGLRWGEDYDMWLRLAAACVLGVLDRVVVRYRQTEAGVSSHRTEHYGAHLRLLRRAFETWPDALSPVERRRAIGDVYATWGPHALSRGAYREAAGALARALRCRPNDARSWWFLALSLPPGSVYHRIRRRWRQNEDP